MLPGDSIHAPPETIPTDLVPDILVWLPVKSLLRFSCVCKFWKSLISDPQFAKKQFRASAMEPTRLNRHRLVANPLHEPHIRDSSLPSIFDSSSAISSQRNCPYKDQKDFRFLTESCHGMLCLATRRHGAVLWNPSTGRFKHLPCLKSLPRVDLNGLVYGFGYDDSSDSYKVVAVSCFGWDRWNADGNLVCEVDVMVHTLGTDSWRVIQSFPASMVLDDSGKFVSGTLNLLTKDGTCTSWVIASLDLGSETYQQLSPPDHGGDYEYDMTSGVLKGCLCILAPHNMASDVWLMKDHGNIESWTKLCSVRYGGMNPRFHPYYAKAFCISEDDEILMDYECKLVVYDFKNGTFRTPWIQMNRGRIIVNVYAESLISPCC